MRSITSILIFLAITYTVSGTGFFLWYGRGYELAAFIPIIAPITAYFVLRKVRKDTIKINFQNISWSGIGLGVFLPIVYMSICVLIYQCMDGELLLDKFKLSFLIQLIVQWVFAGFCEEIGWRGYLLPTLKKAIGKWGAYIICGVIWMSWHLPMIFQNMILTGVSRLAAVILLCLECIIVTIILDRLMSLNKISVWTCVAFHAVHNIIIQQLLELIPKKNYIWLDDGGYLSLAALAITAFILMLYKRKQE